MIIDQRKDLVHAKGAWQAGDSIHWPITVGICSRCGKPVCGVCQRGLDGVSPRFVKGYYRHSRANGCPR